jgi:radical SAM superfamily enzyme YgiQ (UPF0313 family)
MRVLLTHGYSLAYDKREQEIMRPYVPLGILYISAYLEGQGIENHVIDSTFISPEQQWEQLVKFSPDVIGIYVNLMTRQYVVKLIQRIRAYAGTQHTKIILGGPEVRNHAQNWLQAGAHVLVVGEGEITFHALVTQWKAEADLYQIAGIYFNDASGNMHFTGEREKIKHIDVLPFPNRKKVDLHNYLHAWKQRHGINAISISTMRGCPYTCHWCSRAVYGSSYRRRSPEKVVAEMESIQQQYAPDTLWFVDDVFTISHKWLESFAELIQAKNITLAYECITRADRLDEHVIGLLKKSGCMRVWIGAESGSQRIIDAMDRRVEVGQVQEMIRLTRRHGIEAGTFIMLGYPGETEDDILQTVQHLKAAIPDQFTITTAYPIKGTELYTEIQDAVINNPDWATSSDRDIKFKRTYPESYYTHAVRFVVNEVAYAKTGDIRNKIKSTLARTGMWYTRIFA